MTILSDGSGDDPADQKTFSNSTNEKVRPRKPTNGRAVRDPEKAARWAKEGALRGMARRNQMLPWAWNHLTPLDLAEIADLLWELPDTSSDLEKEAAFAIAAILTTGRTLEYLTTLDILDAGRNMLPGKTEPVVIRNRSRPYWWIEAGSPGRQYRRHPPEKPTRPEQYTYEKPALIPFPLSCISKKCFFRLPVSEASGRMPLLWHDYRRLKKTIEQLLRNRREDTRPPRRSSRTLEAIERFLTKAITFESGGDIGAAARLTDSDEVLSRSVIHYGVTRMSATLRRAREATEILNRGVRKEWLPDLPAGLVGNPRCPDWGDVKLLIRRTHDLLRDEQEDVERNHLAMTFYTVSLLSFALGHRGMSEMLPGTLAVDPITGFCKVHDKLPGNPIEARLSWVVPQAWQQMKAYEEHLAHVLPKLNSKQQEEIEHHIVSGRLPIFLLKNGRAKFVSLRKIWRILADEMQRSPEEFRFFENSGRHWVRAELEGKVSTETLHAFLGHWHQGCESWSLGSCLDPLLYRADLIGSLGGLFERVEWKALLANGRPA